MKIEISNLKNKIETLKKIETSYKELTLNYYNNTKDISNYWNNIYEKRLITNIEMEKKQMNKINNWIRDINSLYEHIYNKYNEIGEKIQVNITNEEKIKEKMEKCINKIEKIKKMYQCLDISNLESQEQEIIRSEKFKITVMLKNMDQLKKSTLETIQIVKEIESNIKSRIQKINIEMINETDSIGTIEYNNG